MKHEKSVQLRSPQPGDGARVYELLGSIGTLERNSCYAYVLLCSHFASTGLVAERDGQLLGFVLGYRPPTDPNAVFVWQVGVAPEARGMGLGKRLLQALIEQPGCHGVDHLTATVSPDNRASLSLFRGFARSLGVACEEIPGFPAALFAGPHADENMLRVGPLKG